MFPFLFPLTLDIYPYPYLVETGNPLPRCLMGKSTDGLLTLGIENPSMTNLVGVTNGMPCIYVFPSIQLRKCGLLLVVCRVLPKMMLSFSLER